MMKCGAKERTQQQQQKLHDNKIYDNSKTIDREIGIKIYFLSTSGLNENMHLHTHLLAT